MAAYRMNENTGHVHHVRKIFMLKNQKVSIKLYNTTTTFYKKKSVL
jgi:hypothetical protein